MKLRIFNKNILKNIVSNFKIRRYPISTYSQYLNSEYSQMRITRDFNDNHYFKILKTSELLEQFAYNDDYKPKTR